MEPNFSPSSLKFSGYRLTQDGQARLFLPGHARKRVEAEAVLPGQKEATPVKLRTRGDYWESTGSLPLGTAYRFTIDGNPYAENLEVVTHGGQEFHRISPHEAASPQKSVVIADIFLDALVDRKRLGEYAAQNGGMLPMRNHFNQFGGDEQALAEILPRLKEAGFTSLLFKPFIGGDNLSSHKYWTIDPYVLNNSFSSKEAFKKFLNASLSHGMKLYADGAFVNQGLNGVQMLSNVAHGFRSPYWDWFTYEEDAQPAGQIVYPKHAYEGFNFGILPTVADAEGHRDVAYDRFDVRIINDPRSEDYRPSEYTYVELYDPHTETPDGKPKKAPHNIANSEDSVQKYRFPVSPEEVKRKFDAMYEPGVSLSQREKKQELLEWQSFRDDGRTAFRLSAATLDDSAFKWDGQIDVAKMNMKNPEVVDYVEGAVDYWSRYVQNTYTETVARALSRARTGQAKADPTAWINAITQTGRGKPKPNQVLPPVVLSDVERLTSAEAQAIMEGVQPATEEKNAGRLLTETLMRDYPLMALPLPTFFKGVLSYPALNKMLTEEPNGLLARILSPLAALPVIGPLFAKLKDIVAPPPFQRKLADVLHEVVDRMGGTPQDKLRYARIQSLVAEGLGEAVFLQLFTGQTSTDPQKVEEGFYKTVPQAIIHSDPETAAHLLPRFLKQRLQTLDLTELAKGIEKQVAGLDPQLAVLADELLKRREFGLNWRIDAAKDVADIDRVRNLDPQDRPQAFEEEIDFVDAFWKRIGGKIRETFPKSAIIAELTDFEMLGGDDIAKKAMARLFDNNVFTSTPNMTYLYSSAHELVSYAPRPDEFGANQKTPSGFVEHVIKPMSRNMSFTALRQLQNLTTSHDYGITSHTFLVNPALYTMDHLKWWGLKDDLLNAATELATKACFAAERYELYNAGIRDLDAVLEKLNTLANDPDVVAKLSPDVQNYHSEASKKNGFWEPTPLELKPRMVRDLFAAVPPKALGLTEGQANLLADVLSARISENSEAKAMRGVITNALLNLDWGKLGLPWDEDRIFQLKQSFNMHAFEAVNKAIDEWGRPFGSQPLDIALDNVFKHLPDQWIPVPPEEWVSTPSQGHTARSIKEQVKTQLYADATRPVLSKLLRVFAVQNAIPGNPSIYLPDLFAQGGSEWLKNVFVQNRNLIRVDKLAEDAEFQAFFAQVGEIFNTRQQLPALTNGIVLPLSGDDANGILPVVRDNGQQQVITLINAGKPSEVDWNLKVGKETGYTDIRTTQPVVKNYKPDLSELQLAPGTTYKDVHTGEVFTLNADGKLEDANGKGMDIAISRMLVRQSKPAKTA